MPLPRARILLASSLLLSCAAAAQDLASFEKRVTRKILPNGMTILVCERPAAPVFSFFTHVDAGSDRATKGVCPDHREAGVMKIASSEPRTCS